MSSTVKISTDIYFEVATLSHWPTLIISKVKYFQVQNALHEMLQCMDRGKPEDCERFAQLFTEDAVVEVPLAKVYKLEIQKSDEVS